LVRVGRAIYALPLANVNECVELAAAELASESGRSMLRVRDAMVPFFDLGRLFRQPTDEGALRRVVIVNANGRRLGLMVDDILGQNQTVIKTLSPFHRDIGVFSGATILGDGRVALIIDVAHLVKSALEQPSGGRTPLTPEHRTHVPQRN
jgi:two-component system chemotaxis sensor kinase CheA